LSSVFTVLGRGEELEIWKPYSLKTKVDGLVPIDEFVKYNTGQPNTIGTGLKPASGDYMAAEEISLEDRHQPHNWYGGVISKQQPTNELTLDFGVDMRTYTGFTFRNL
jgi:hypothetical protein